MQQFKRQMMQLGLVLGMAESRSKAKTYSGAALAECGEELDIGNERVGLSSLVWQICLILFGCQVPRSVSSTELVLTKYLLNR